MAGLRVHALNCGTMCPLARRFINGDGGVFQRGRMICQCLLVELPTGLLLVDSGIGTEDCRLGFGGVFNALGAPRYGLGECAVAQVAALGFDPRDVRDIVVTHLDLDHAGGLPDFPQARVHLHAREHAAAAAPPTFAERQRYLRRHFQAVQRWETYAAHSGAGFFGFEAVRDLRGLPPEVLLVPLHGHSRGHSGVAVHTEQGWLLHGGDAWFSQGDLCDPPTTPGGLRLFQRLAAVDNAERLRNQVRLRALAQAGHPDLRLISAHDPRDLAPRDLAAGAAPSA